MYISISFDRVIRIRIDASDLRIMPFFLVQKKIIELLKKNTFMNFSTVAWRYFFYDLKRIYYHYRHLNYTIIIVAVIVVRSCWFGKLRFAKHICKQQQKFLFFFFSHISILFSLSLSLSFFILGYWFLFFRRQKKE